MTKLFEYREYKNTETPVPFCWKVLATLFTASVFLAMAVVCGSCQSDEIDAEVVVEEEQPATLRLEVAGEEQMDIATRAVVEDKISNLHVLVYNSSGDLIGQKYQTGSSVTVNTVVAENCTVYAIANTGNASLFSGYDIHKKTYFESLVRTVSAWNAFTSGADLPMTGSVSNVNITASSTLSMTLTRMVAKVTLNIGIETGSGITINDYSLCNIPRKSYYVPRPTKTEADDKDTNNTAAGDDAASAASDYWAAGDKISVNSTVVNATYYMFENRRGVKTNITTQDEKGGSNVPANATYVNINGTLNNTLVNWKVYLGANNNNNFNIKRNFAYTCKITLKATGVADSRITFNPAGIVDLSKDGKANCYLASADNKWYSFDATVRGNGETQDYANMQYGSGISLFPSKIDGGATAVDIPKAKVKDAVVVWETSQGLINWVVWDRNSGCVKFRTGTAKGNAVIAVRDVSGKILWSWHIWRTEGVDLSALNANHTIDVTTNTNRQWYLDEMAKEGTSVVGRTRQITMLNCNLGAQLNAAKSYTQPSGNIGAFCLQYQFGRKDPFPGVTSYDATTATDVTVYGYGSNSNTYNGTGFTTYSKKQSATSVTSNNGQATLNYAIEHPDVFLCGTTVDNQPQIGINWIDNASVGTTPWKVSRCLWGDNNTAKAFVNAKGLDPDPWGTTKESGKKTIYDPCPAGWRVSPADSWTGTANASAPASWILIGESYLFRKVTTNGYIYYFGSLAGVSTYCPSTGQRAAATGLVESIGSLGTVWWSSPSGTTSPGATYFYSTAGAAHTASDHGLAMGFPVRCAKM